jgi:hypothetical protein
MKRTNTDGMNWEEALAVLRSLEDDLDVAEKALEEILNETCGRNTCQTGQELAYSLAAEALGKIQ